MSFVSDNRLMGGTAGIMVNYGIMGNLNLFCQNGWKRIFVMGGI